MSERPKAVVLLSGGMDSCVTAAIARQTHELAFVHASYGQRTERRERQAFDAVARGGVSVAAAPATPHRLHSAAAWN